MRDRGVRRVWVLVVAVMLCPNSTRAQDHCPIRSGPWQLVATETIGSSVGRIAARDNAGGTAQIKSQMCSDSFVLSGGGKDMRFFKSGIEGDTKGYSSIPIKQGRGTYKVLLEAVSSEKLEGKIQLSGEFGVERDLAYDYVGETESRPLACECDDPEVLDPHFEAMAAEQEYFEKVFANPEYWEKPPGFPDDKKWNAYGYELLINQILDGKGYEKAAEIVAGKASDPDFGEDPDPAAQSESSPTDAWTDTNTCQIRDATLRDDVCFPYLDLHATLFHERLHQERCCSTNRTYNQWMTDLATGSSEGERPPRYMIAVNTPKEAGLEETRAYKASAKHLRDWRTWLPDWKAGNCPKAKPLPPKQIPCP